MGASLQLYFNDSDHILPFVEPIAGADDNQNSLDLFDVLEAYIDAPRPRRSDPLDETTNNFITTAPYRCPSDRGSTDAENPDPWHATYGLSYRFPPSEAYIALELFGLIDPEDPDSRWVAQRAVSKTLDHYSGMGLKLAILLDGEPWHAAGPNDGRNALFWDGSADAYPGDPPAETLNEIIEMMFRLAGM